jgi:hypothetical protein
MPLLLLRLPLLLLRLPLLLLRLRLLLLRLRLLLRLPRLVRFSPPTESAGALANRLLLPRVTLRPNATLNLRTSRCGHDSWI